MSKAQTATEYLIIVAIVLVISIIVISIVADVSFLDKNANKQSLDAAAKTADILIEHHEVTNFGLRLELRNPSADTIELQNITVDEVSCAQPLDDDACFPYLTCTDWHASYDVELPKKVKPFSKTTILCKSYRIPESASVDPYFGKYFIGAYNQDSYAIDVAIAYRNINTDATLNTSEVKLVADVGVKAETEVWNMPIRENLLFYFPFSEESGTTFTDIIGGITRNSGTAAAAAGYDGNYAHSGEFWSKVNFTSGRLVLQDIVDDVGYSLSYFVKVSYWNFQTATLVNEYRTTDHSCTNNNYANWYFATSRSTSNSLIYSGSSVAGDLSGWNHVAHIRNSSHVSTYINGALTNTTTAGSTTVLGFSAFCSISPMSMWARDFAMFNGSLTSAQIELLNATR